LKIICLILSLFITQAWGATLCVGPSSSGSANGTDWNNKLAWSATLVRGNTYYLEDGTYAAKTHSVSISGATTIEIKKATVADHGTSTGWVDTMGDGQAIFSDTQLITTGNYIFNGQAGSGLTLASYGFNFAQGSGSNQRNIEIGSGTQNISNLVFAYFSGLAVSGDFQKEFVYMSGQASCVNFTFTNILSDGFQNHVFMSGLQGGWVENCWLTNSFSSAGHHGDGINLREGALGACRNITFKNNRADSNGTGMIVINDDGVGDDFSANGVLITGNVIGPSWTGGNGVICTTTRAAGANITVVNNTFWFCTNLWISAAQSGSSTAVKNACTNWFATNNILYTMSGALGNNATALITNDYNYYVSCTSVPTEANGVSTSSDPFVSVAGRNFNLGVAVPGLALGSTFSPDQNGVTRGADGTWDRGAYEFTNSTAATVTFRVQNFRPKTSFFR